jgi:hypothetical protein
MADGVAAAGLANPWLAVLAGTTFTGLATFVQLHTGPPGPAGTNNVSSVITRPSLTWGVPLNGANSITNTPTWSNWPGTNGEIVTDISVWDAASAGTFRFSAQLAIAQVMNTGGLLQLIALTLTMTPIAA